LSRSAWPKLSISDAALRTDQFPLCLRSKAISGFRSFPLILMVSTPWLASAISALTVELTGCAKFAPGISPIASIAAWSISESRSVNERLEILSEEGNESITPNCGFESQLCLRWRSPRLAN
jgi:hypothetical protein